MASCLASNGCSSSRTCGCNKNRERDMLLTRDNLPDTIADIAALDELLCRPSQALIDDASKFDGDIMILGVAGKMGPTLAGLAKAALPDRKITCVGRERMFEYFSRKFSTPGRLFRLNYAIDMRYGVLHDIASKVLTGKPIDVSLGHVNFIWQGDASAQALRCLAHCDTPTSPINVSGHEILAVRDLAAKFGQRFGRAPVITGKEEPTAWLTDTSQAVKLFGLPVVDTDQLIRWTADWVSRAMPSLGKPTRYEVRAGRY